MKRIIVIAVIILITVNACKKDELQITPESINAELSSSLVDNNILILPESDHYDSIPQDPLNLGLPPNLVS